MKICLFFCEAVVINLLVCFIFYNSLYAFFLLLFFPVIYIRKRLKKEEKKQRLLTTVEFADAMNCVVVLLRAGYSIENAFVEAKAEVAQLCKKKSMVNKWFQNIDYWLSNNKTMEVIITEFAKASRIQDIISFSEVFCYAKRSGGDMVEIISETVDTIKQKTDISKDIEVLISAKQMEQKVMIAIVPGLILYLRYTSPSLIEKLYGNLYGMLVMTGCLLVYGASVLIGMKITDIKV